MINLLYENMIIEISADQEHSSTSENNKYKYKNVHKLLNLDRGEQYSIKYSIIIRDQDDNIINSAIVIADNYGIIPPNEGCAVIKNNSIIMAIGSYIVGIELSNLSLQWSITTENCYECFTVYIVGNRYIVHCEGSIIGISEDGTFEWEFTGRDIFVSLNGTNEFTIKEEWIELRDFEDNEYRIRFDGTEIKEINELHITRHSHH